jgi:hypothetical protein
MSELPNVPPSMHRTDYDPERDHPVPDADEPLVWASGQTTPEIDPRLAAMWKRARTAEDLWVQERNRHRDSIRALLTEDVARRALDEFSWDNEVRPHPLDFRDWMFAALDIALGVGDAA